MNEVTTTTTTAATTTTVSEKGNVKSELNGKKSESKISNQPRPLVLCGPSGSGKSSLVSALSSKPEFGPKLAFSVSHTTRAPRPGELHGREYFFTDRASMRREIESGKFVEFAEYSGNLYGTSKEAVRRCLEGGKVCVLDIDSQGVRQLKADPSLDPVYVFVRPPTVKALEERLRQRGTEDEEAIRRRLEAAEAELRFGSIPGNFDVVIVNDVFNEAVDKLERALRGCLGGEEQEEQERNGSRSRNGDEVNGDDQNGDRDENGGTDENDGERDDKGGVAKNGGGDDEKGGFGVFPAKRAKSGTPMSRDATPGVER